MYTEPFIVAMLDIVPGISILSFLFKIKVLSTNNTWHESVYKKTYGHLRDFDVIDVLWQFSSNRVLNTVCNLLKLTGYLYPKLTVEQLERLGEELDTIRDDLEAHKKKNSHRASVRASRMFHKSQLDAGIPVGSVTPRKERNTTEKEPQSPVNRKDANRDLSATKRVKTTSVNKKEK